VQLGQSLRVTQGGMKGTIGTLRDVRCDDRDDRDDRDCLVLETETGALVTIQRVEATQIITERRKDENGRMVVVTKGKATRWQFAVRTGFGQTVHGVQGRSLRRFVVGCDGYWEHGQAYVALSRATDPALVFLKDVERLAFKCDSRVRDFYQKIAARGLPAYAR
jgi:hypothetical protein